MPRLLKQAWGQKNEKKITCKKATNMTKNVFQMHEWVSKVDLAKIIAWFSSFRDILNFVQWCMSLGCRVQFMIKFLAERLFKVLIIQFLILSTHAT